MPDYNKLTVVKLRDELQKRGLPKNGLKPALVSRLNESDAQSKNAGMVNDSRAAESTGLKSQKAAVDESQPQVQTNAPGGLGAGGETNGVEHGVVQHLEKEAGATKDPVSKEKEVVPPDIEPAQAVQANDTSPPLPEKTVEDQPSKHIVDTATGAPDETVHKQHTTDSINTTPREPEEAVHERHTTDMMETIPRAPEEPVQEQHTIDLMHTAPRAPEEPVPEQHTTDLMDNAPRAPEQPGDEQSSSPAVETNPHAPEETVQAKPPIHALDIANGSSANENPTGARPSGSSGISGNISEEETPIPSPQNDTQFAELAQASLNQTVWAKPSLTIENQLAESTQVSVTASELLEDSRKRKRRSKSPAPLTQEIAQKRAKMEGSRSDVKLPEDLSEEEQDVETEKSKDTIMADATLTQPPKPVESASDDTPRDAKHKSTAADFTAPNDQIDKSESVPSDRLVSEKLKEPQPEHSPSDARFKNLFTGTSRKDASPVRQVPYSDEEDRVVGPALHPATSALYIRNFMRPLQPGNLRDHLVALAKPSGASANEESITEFFLDNIRTHCLVRFVNTSAASRVRSNLHSRVWPDERARRPLWVDFVPEEKLQKWIEVERRAPVGRGQPAKRWEVVYEDEGDGMKAYLQEAGSNPNPSRGEGGQGVQGAPSGPRSREVEPRASLSGETSKPDSGRGFQALDDLFKSTVAKPKLYYLPVNKATVDRRLKKLDAGRGGGRGNEMRRYTFEDGIIVDRGPEYGSRGRGGHGGRGAGGGGGYGGGFHGRGGGYRGDNWRERR